MVPADFIPFFSVMAGVGATLFGLVFLIITIRPEVTDAEKTTVMQQVQIASSYSALLNPLIISLLALVPHTTIGTVTLIMGAIGLGNTIIMGVSLLQDASNGAKKLRSIGFIIGSLIIFGFEFFYAIQLTIWPENVSALSNLTTFLVIIYLYGVLRAWDLAGVRQFHLRELYLPFLPRNIEEILSDTPHAENPKEASKLKD
ncbi:hypothetical protein KDH_23110 [Dictyobacter sp. S3.2.2.5]|uniref:Uncharacterized protein n=1 Tax=Dictyobacter halimunensis TaxID=3026934 RepID=A0ABQ6FP55_9CHLR|nr:hypothetical protein KDH_23110 [Dictyobacter sp. S3.2.2.5]